MVLTNFDDKLVRSSGEFVDVYAWGAQDYCLTQPILQGV